MLLPVLFLSVLHIAEVDAADAICSYRHAPRRIVLWRVKFTRPPVRL